MDDNYALHVTILWMTALQCLKTAVSGAKIIRFYGLPRTHEHQWSKGYAHDYLWGGCVLWSVLVSHTPAKCVKCLMKFEQAVRAEHRLWAGSKRSLMVSLYLLQSHHQPPDLSHTWDVISNVWVQARHQCYTYNTCSKLFVTLTWSSQTYTATHHIIIQFFVFM